MSNIPARPQPNLDEVIERANAELKKTDSTPFSEHALEKFQEQVRAYTVELIQESVKRAKRHQAEVVSSSDVRHASQYLVSSPSHKIYRHAGTLGGLFFGAALSNVMSMITTRQYGLDGIIITFAFTLIGASLITVHMVKD
jgi:histone H3/H4